ncbi:MAG: GNAT family N-acetyltransferase [Beijerinckiaceae bacterium]
MSLFKTHTDAHGPSGMAQSQERREWGNTDRPPFTISILSPRQLANHAAAIDALAERALRRNVFYESAFLIHAGHHLQDAGSLQIVLIWRGGEGDQLVGLFPFVLSRLGLATRKARGWLSHFMADGTPLIDAAYSVDVVGAYLASIGRSEKPAAGALFPLVDIDGPFAALLRSIASRKGLEMAGFDEHQRAVMSAGAGAESASLRGKKRKELQRLERRLGQLGALTNRSATSPADVRDAFEQFLALEVRGWKGRAGSAIMQDPAAAAFARSSIRALAAQGRCRIDLIEFDGQPISAAIELTAGDRSYFWKTAYDENYARYSPGVQAALQLTRRQADSGREGCVDSCAKADHPMIDHLWSERMSVADLFIGASAARSGVARTIVRREHLRRRGRAIIKQAYRALRPQKAA